MQDIREYIGNQKAKTGNKKSELEISKRHFEEAIKLIWNGKANTSTA